MKPVLHLENVSKIYRTLGEEVYALKDVDFRIEKNDFISVVGPSGSGKSTLLHIIGLLDEPTKGKVYLDGIETSTMAEDSLAYLRGKKIGFIFQAFNLIPTLTVLENVALPALIYNEMEENAYKKASRILNEIGMGERLFYYPNQISGGQKQRVAVARALINEPELILADEPTGNLDSKTGEDVLKLFKDLHDQGKTIVIITHDLNITKITEKKVKIKDGKLEVN